MADKNGKHSKDEAQTGGAAGNQVPGRRGRQGGTEHLMGQPKKEGGKHGK